MSVDVGGLDIFASIGLADEGICTGVPEQSTAMQGSKQLLYY